MIEELTNPQSPPKIGGGSAIELKLTGVLDNYRAEYFSVPHRAFIPSKTPYIKGDAILFKVDVYRIYNKVSSRAPRFGLVYSGHKCIVVENLHPLVPAAPFEPEKHNRGPPTSVPHPSITLGHRGAGHSDVHAFVPSCADTNCRLVPFLALLIAINAPPGMLTFADPDPALALAGYEIISLPPVPLLSLRTVLPSGRDATVHRGTLGERAPRAAPRLDAYECMEGLECVPRCLGVYAPAHRAWAALLLEDKGDSLGNDEWKDLDLDFEER
ncbi:hypothetical protein B0H14DRAFT_2792084 [Mycena olivaceomarginata]|nr:hypothetical protein B0H14DRAFT_2792084 [Mycena olivaceomarginata]